MSYGTVQAEKMTTESGYSLGAGNASSFKNRIINGEMDVVQRYGTTSVSVDGANIVNPDRWVNTEIGDGAFTAQQVADAPAGFVNSLRVTTTTVQTGTLNAVTRQSIEGFNISDLGWGTANAKSVTLSFWVKSSLTGSFGGAIRNDAGDRSYPFSYTINSANTWEYETITIPGDTTGTWLTNNSTGLTVWFSHGTSSTGTAGAWVGADVRAPAGSVFIIQTLNATWQITGVQLEVGTVATSFDFRSYGTELALCQRYFEQVGPGMPCKANSTTQFWCGYTYRVAKRSSTTFSLVSTTVRIFEFGVSNRDTSSCSIGGSYATNPNTGLVLLEGFSGLSGGVNAISGGAGSQLNDGPIINCSSEL